MPWEPHPVLASGDTDTDCAVEQTCRRHAGRETEGKKGGVLAVSEGHWPEDQGWVLGLYSPAQRTGLFQSLHLPPPAQNDHIRRQESLHSWEGQEAAHCPTRALPSPYSN